MPLVGQQVFNNVVSTAGLPNLAPSLLTEMVRRLLSIGTCGGALSGAFVADYVGRKGGIILSASAQAFISASVVPLTGSFVASGLSMIFIVKSTFNPRKVVHLS